MFENARQRDNAQAPAESEVKGHDRRMPCGVTSQALVELVDDIVEAPAEPEAKATDCRMPAIATGQVRVEPVAKRQYLQASGQHDTLEAQDIIVAKGHVCRLLGSATPPRKL